jgi:ribosomal protein S27AE
MNEHMKTLTLNCTNCGAGLEVSQDMERFACGYCGTQQIVERKGGTVALKPLTDAIRMVQTGTDKTAAELALKRMGEELAALHGSYRARQGQASVAKNSAMTSAVVGTIVIGLVALIAVSNTVGEVGSLIVVGLAIGICIMIVKRTSRPIEEQLQTDLAAIGAKARDLERRIAEKRAIADS